MQGTASVSMRQAVPRFDAQEPLTGTSPAHKRLPGLLRAFVDPPTAAEMEPMTGSGSMRIRLVITAVSVQQRDRIIVHACRPGHKERNRLSFGPLLGVLGLLGVPRLLVNLGLSIAEQAQGEPGARSELDLAFGM